jgi:Leucine-rich repeat (LRR) protein
MRLPECVTILNLWRSHFTSNFSLQSTIGKPTMHSKSLYKICGLFLFSLIAGCKTYSLSVNNKVVYTPPSLFKDFSIADEHLRACVEQTILDNQITKAENLKQLNCSHAGINSLAGLEKFHAIEQLNLAENALQSVIPITNFSQLKVLILRKNNLTSAEPLLHLLALREVDISENTKLGCGDLKQLTANFHQGDLKLILPEQCAK